MHKYYWSFLAFQFLQIIFLSLYLLIEIVSAFLFFYIESADFAKLLICI